MPPVPSDESKISCGLRVMMTIAPDDDGVLALPRLTGNLFTTLPFCTTVIMWVLSSVVICNEFVADHDRRQDPHDDGGAERQGREEVPGEPGQGEHAVVVRRDGHHDPQPAGDLRLVAGHRRHPGRRSPAGCGS